MADADTPLTLGAEAAPAGAGTQSATAALAATNDPTTPARRTPASVTIHFAIASTSTHQRAATAKNRAQPAFDPCEHAPERIRRAAELIGLMQTYAVQSARLLSARVKVPAHAVYRSFPSETVGLNLETGMYHGLNATAGRILEELQRAPCVADAIAALAETYGQPYELVERDVCELCGSLLERGLIELDGAA
jgi:hypothetical protein